MLLRLKDKISRLRNNKYLSDEKVVRGIVITMKEMGWSYQQMMETPIPTYFEVVSVLEKEAKKQEGESKKLGKKK